MAVKLLVYLAWATAMFFIIFDYSMTWIYGSCLTEGNEITRWLWCNYGKWTLLVQLGVEMSIFTIVAFGYDRLPKELVPLLMIMVFIGAAYVHWVAGSGWLRLYGVIR